MDDDEDNKPIVQSDRTNVSEEKYEDNESLVQLASEEKALKRESSSIRRVLARSRRRKDFQSGEIRVPHWNKVCQETRASDQKKSRVWAKNSYGEALQKITNKMSDVCNLKDFCLKYYHLLDILG